MPADWTLKCKEYDKAHSHENELQDIRHDRMCIVLIEHH